MDLRTHPATLNAAPRACAIGQGHEDDPRSLVSLRCKLRYGSAADIGLYLGGGATTSAYGAAGILAVLLLWRYYSAQVYLLGAKFTHLFAKHRRGSHHPAFLPNREAAP